MRYVTGIFPVLAMLLASVASAASGSVEMRLRALESRLPDADRMAELEKTVGSQGAAILAADIEQLKAEVRELRGQIEQLTHQIRQHQQSQQQLYKDLDSRLQALEVIKPTLPITGGTQVTSDAIEGVAGQPGVDEAGRQVGPEQAEYLAAFELLQQGKTGEAIHGFTGFLNKYPQSSYSANALYWLGEANYLNKDFSSAMAEFKKLVNNHPDNAKTPGAWLKIGYIHYETRNYPEARAVLEKVRGDFPNTNVSKLADERLQRMQKEGV